MASSELGSDTTTGNSMSATATPGYWPWVSTFTSWAGSVPTLWNQQTLFL